MYETTVTDMSMRLVYVENNDGDVLVTESGAKHCLVAAVVRAMSSYYFPYGNLRPMMNWHA